MSHEPRKSERKLSGGGSPRSGKSNQTSPDPSQLKLQRKSLALENLITTEKSYVEHLDTLIKVFVTPLSDNNVLSANRRQILFSNVKEIYSAHVVLYSDLECLSSISIQEVVGIYLKQKTNLTVHVDFYCSVDEALEKLEEIKNTEPNTYKKLVNSESFKLRLKDSLKEVNEIFPQYNTVFQELIRAYEKSVADKELIEGLIKHYNDLAAHLTECKKDHANREKTRSLMNHLTNIKWSKHRFGENFGKLVMEDDVLVKSKALGLDRKRYLIVMEKVLLVAKRLKEEELYFEKAINLQIARIHDDALQSLQIRIEVKDSDSLIILPASKEQYRKWSDSLRRVGESLIPTNAVDEHHNFILNTFSQHTSCDVCGLLLKGLTSQGYICIRTGSIAHKDCMSSCKDLPNGTNLAKRLKLQEPLVELPIRKDFTESDRLLFGGYFGCVAPGYSPLDLIGGINNVQSKEMLMKSVEEKIVAARFGTNRGGFKYTNLELKHPRATSPATFIMWESKSRGINLQRFPKAGFIERLCDHLAAQPREITLKDVEEFTQQYEGHVNHHKEEITGETFTIGHYKESEDLESSEEEASRLSPWNRMPSESLSGHLLSAGSGHQTSSKSRSRERLQTTSSQSSSVGKRDSSNTRARANSRTGILQRDMSSNRLTIKNRSPSSHKSPNASTTSIGKSYRL